MAELTITEKTTFCTEECITCSVVFAVTDTFQQQRKRSHANFWCPNGHSQYYPGKSDVELAKERQAKAEATMQAERDQRLAAERELKRHQTRAKGGACPCCKRSSVQLARHMKSQHPDFPPETVGVGAP